MVSNVLVHRDPPLRQLIRLMEAHQPDIVAGDFNAPRRSLALDPLPVGFRHAYEVAGKGWSYSWPILFPVYAIDQCILGKRIVPIRYELASSIHSDHRRQILEFSVARVSRG